VFRVDIYKQGHDCPDLRALPNPVIPNDIGFYTKDPSAEEGGLNPYFVESTSSSTLYFGECYASYGFGHFKATRTPDTDRSTDTAYFNYNCKVTGDGHCTECTVLQLGQGACTTSGIYDFKMTWINGVSRLESAWLLLVFLSLISFF